jgi:dihydrofolate reductase
MAKLVVSEFVSLDGVMEDPGGAEKTEYGGWTFPYWNDEIGAFKFAELFASDAMLLGYQGFAAAWPAMTDEQGFADRMNGMTKHVVSSTLDNLEWNNSHLVDGDLETEITKLKENAPGDILVAGSAALAQALMRLGLVDELRLAIYPVVLGSGKRLFGEGGHTNLELVEQQTTSTGVVLSVYRRTEAA